MIESAAARPAKLSLVGTASARLFVACALARPGPLLVVTATGREAGDLTDELRGVFAFPALPRGAEDHWNEKRVFHL